MTSFIFWYYLYGILSTFSPSREKIQAQVLNYNDMDNFDPRV